MILLDNLIHASGNGDFRIYYKVDGSYRTDNKYSRRLIRTDQGELIPAVAITTALAKTKLI